MVHFILFILKIIGIILASILGILLLLILVVLFVPIRYQIYGKKREDMKLEGRVTWLLHLIYLRVTYESNKSIIKLKVFGKTFYDSQNLKDKKNKIKKDKKKVKDKKVKDKKVKDKGIKDKKVKDKGIKDKNIGDKNISDKNIRGKNVKDENVGDKNTKDNIKENKDIKITSKTEGNGLTEEAADNVIGKVNIENIKDVVEKVKDTVTEKVKEELVEEPIEKAMDDTEKEACKKENDKSFVQSIDKSTEESTEESKEESTEESKEESAEESKEESKEESTEESKDEFTEKSIDDDTKEKEENSFDSDEAGEANKGLFYKFKTLLRKLLKIPKKIIELFIKVKNSIKKVFYIIIGFLEKWHKIKAFLQNEINKKGLKNAFVSLKKIFIHIRPKKLNIAVEFGTGDPCSTGQLLGGLSILYGYYGETVQITPNFETEILEGSIYCKGRIRLFTLLIICIKLILNKEFRKLIENFKAFKEEF